MTQKNLCEGGTNNEKFNALDIVSCRDCGPNLMCPLYSCALMAKLSHDGLGISSVWAKDASMGLLPMAVDSIHSRIGPV